MYLLSSSCHPAHISNNISYSLGYRIVRICSKPELRDAKFLKIRNFLLSRDYNSSIVDSAIAIEKLIRARIPDPPRMRPNRLIPGMKPCGLNCPTCRYVEPGTVIQSSNTSKKIKINGTFNCKTRNEVYCITWEQCKLQYIGQTTRSLSLRLGGLLGNQP